MLLCVANAYLFWGQYSGQFFVFKTLIHLLYGGLAIYMLLVSSGMDSGKRLRRAALYFSLGILVGAAGLFGEMWSESIN